MKRMIMWGWFPLVLLGISGRLNAANTVNSGLISAIPDSIGSYRLSLAERYTTNLIFPFAIAQVDLGSGDVIAKKIGKAENVLLLKAGIGHFAPTNVSVYLENGKLYSFFVSYADSLTVFNYFFPADVPSVPSSPRMQFGDWPVPKDSLQTDAQKVIAAKHFLHIRKRAAKMGLTLESAYIKDKLLWLGLRGQNKSLIDFRAAPMQFSIEDTRRVRRTAVQSIALKPVYRAEPEILRGDASLRWAVALTPITVARGKKLVIGWNGNDGRRIRLVIKGNHILKAKALN